MGPRPAYPFLWFLCQTTQETWAGYNRIRAAGTRSIWFPKPLASSPRRMKRRQKGGWDDFVCPPEQWPGSQSVPTWSYPVLEGTPFKISNPFRSRALPALSLLLYNCLPIGLRGLPGFLPILKIMDSTIWRNPTLDLSATTSSFPFTSKLV